MTTQNDRLARCGVASAGRLFVRANRGRGNSSPAFGSLLGRVIPGHVILRRFALGLLACIALTGCAPRFLSPELPLASGVQASQNPAFVTVLDQDFLWAQITDELDNYFHIRREERVRIIQNTLTDGWVETYPTTGASVLEPWRRDAASGYQRWLGTLQSIRRWARVEVAPVGEQFKIEVFVYRELEDLDRPVGSGIGDLTLRHDNSPEQTQDPTWYEPDQYGWISIGRDAELEQKILTNIINRLGPL